MFFKMFLVSSHNILTVINLLCIYLIKTLKGRIKLKMQKRQYILFYYIVHIK